VPGALYFVQQSAKSGAAAHALPLWSTEINGSRPTGRMVIPGGECFTERILTRGPACHAANPTESRNRCIDCRKAAIWFQLGMLGDATACGSIPVTWVTDYSEDMGNEASRGTLGPSRLLCGYAQGFARIQRTRHELQQSKPLSRQRIGPVVGA